MGTFAWDPWFGLFRLAAFALELPAAIPRIDNFVWELSFGNVWLGTFAWTLSFGYFRLAAFAWELLLGNFRLEPLDWDLRLGELGSFLPGERAGGSWLTLHRNTYTTRQLGGPKIVAWSLSYQIRALVSQPI